MFYAVYLKYNILIPGNGPSSLALSFLLAGNLPYYNGTPLADEYLSKRLIEEIEVSLVDKVSRTVKLHQSYLSNCNHIYNDSKPLIHPGQYSILGRDIRNGISDKKLVLKTSITIHYLLSVFLLSYFVRTISTLS